MNPAVQEERHPLADSAVLTVEQGLPLPTVLVTHSVSGPLHSPSGPG